MNVYAPLLSAAQAYDELHLKIGIDTGRFLCDLAARHPRHFYIGIEIRQVAVDVAQERVRRRELRNVIVVRADAEVFLSGWPTRGDVDAIHIYHPTPNPRTVGLDHQLINRVFVADCGRVIRAWGTLRLITDDEEYFSRAMHCFDTRTWWSIDWVYEDLARQRHSFVGSPTELDYRGRGATIHAAHFLRRA